MHVHCARSDRRRATDHQIHRSDDRANGDLRHRTRVDGDEETDEEELTQHLGELPPEGRDIVLAIEESDGARERRLLARNDGGRRLEQQNGTEGGNSNRIWARGAQAGSERAHVQI